MPTELLLCRHGQTEWNVLGRLQGQLDTELDMTGRQQAGALASALASRLLHAPLATAVYSSDLSRVSETAAICVRACCSEGGGMPPIRLDARLRERKLGLFEGLTVMEAKSKYPIEWKRFISGQKVDGVEDDEQIAARVGEALRDVASKHPGCTILVFSHGGAIHSGIRALTGAEALREIGNCSISQLRAAHGSLGRWDAISIGENLRDAQLASNADVQRLSTC
mmetsp:Transcript_21900/g.66507  ORF Transcript_21900/g.66507 Transcript_21900/m.66507 type:complete len:224 (+) Transcript_21900:122-793(+)|eukprot:scaffold118093_cov28-Tisochrysis_lutea.AAC.1